MSDFTTWIQTNWYSLGSLLAQFALLAGGVWFAGKILKTLRATQQQFGALLKLSMTQEPEEHSMTGEAIHHNSVAEDRPSPYVMAEWPTAKQAPSLSDELTGRAKTSASMTATEEPTPYVAAPLTLPEEGPSGGHLAAAGRGVVRWLQTPMKTNSVSPWRRVLRWLQAPARS